MNISEFRSKYPEYNDVSDDDLTKSLHKKHYSDLPLEDFSKKFRGTAAPTDYSSGFKVFGETPGAQALPTVMGMARGLSGFGGTVLGGLAGGLEGLADPKKTVFGQGEKRGREWGEAFKEFIPAISDRTHDVEKNMIEPAFSAMRQGVGNVAETVSTMGRMGEVTQGTTIPEAARTLGEVGFDVYGAAALGKSAGRTVGKIRESAEARAKARDAADAAPPVKEPTKSPIMEQLELEFNQQVPYAGGKAGGKLRPEDLVVDRDGIPFNQKLSEEIARNTGEADLFGAPDPIPDRGVYPRPIADERAPIPYERTPLPVEAPPVSEQLQRPGFRPEEGLPIVQDTLAERFGNGVRSSVEDRAWAQKAAEETANRVVPPIEDAFRRMEEQRRMDAQADALRRQAFEQEAQGIPPREPSQGGPPNVVPTSRTRLAGVPRGQRGAMMPDGKSLVEMVGSWWFDTYKRSHQSEKSMANAAVKIAAVNKSDRDAVAATKGDERSVAEFYAQDFPGGKPVDIPSRREAPISRKADAIAGQLAEVVSDPGGAYRWNNHPIFKYIPDRVRSINSRWNMYNDILKEGIRIYNGKNVIDPNAVAPRISHMSLKERGQVAEIANAINRDGRPIVKAEWLEKGFGNKAIDAAIKMQENLKNVLSSVNETLVKNGRSPIHELPFYFMKFFGDGRFVTRIVERGVDKAGKETTNNIAFQRTGSPAEGAAWAAKYMEEMKVRGIDTSKMMSEKPVFSKPSDLANKMNLSPGVISDIMRALAKDDPRLAVLKEIDAKFVNEGRAGGHSAKRKGRGGGELDGQTILKAYERYVDQMTTYARNVEIDGIRREMQRHPDTLPSDSRAMQWTNNYLESQMGGTRAGWSWLKGLEEFLNDGLSMHRLGGVRHINHIASRSFSKSIMLMLNPVFATAAFGQSVGFGRAGLRSYAVQHGLPEAGVGSAFANAFVYMTAPSKQHKSFIDWLASRGSIDPTMIKEWTSVNTKLDKFTDYALLEALPKAGERFGRIHSALMGYEFLYEKGYRGQKLWQEAERISRDYVMGDYSKEGRARILRDSGFAGDAARTLSTFYNFYLNNIGNMMTQASRGKVGPFVDFYIMSTLLTGVIGAPFINEIGAVWDSLKKTKWFQEAAKELGYNINETSPTAKEWILQNMPDAAVFGPLDAALGVRMSGGMAAPEVHFPGDSKLGQWGSGLFPGYAYIAQVVPAALSLLKDVATDHLTEGGRKQALKDLAPGKMVDSLIENWDLINSDQNITTMGSRGSGGYERKNAFEVGASIVGAGTLKEQRQKIAGFEKKDRDMEVSASRTTVITKLADLVKANKTETKQFNDLIDRAVALGVKPKDISQAIRDNLRDRELTKEQRDAGKGRTSRQQRSIIDSILMEEASR